MPRSLLIFRHSAYEECLHGIDEVVQDHFSHQEDDLTLYGLQAPCSLHRKSERVSLTIRRVPRVQLKHRRILNKGVPVHMGRQSGS
ncbi:hypothetical protein WJX84_009002 [Apatococcus fuscideae]|uniref:Uncharacterized protein n=1 Tax=Apatococcus fuscideae TaxID=2026836 RepID=A0AAW1TIW7_9CHLO